MQKITSINEIRELEARSVKWVKDTVLKKYNENSDIGYAILITNTDYSKIDENNLVSGKYFYIWVGVQKNQIILEREKDSGEWIGAIFSPIEVSSKFLGFGKLLGNFEEDVKKFFEAEMDNIREVYLKEQDTHYANVFHSEEMTSQCDEVVWIG